MEEVKIIDLNLVLLNKYFSSKASELAVYERYAHSLSVALTACDLVKHYHFDEYMKKAYIAGLFHDYAKFMTYEQYQDLIGRKNLLIILDDYPNKVWHGVMGPYAIEDELLITDQEILKAVGSHISGKPDMSLLEKIIYIADYIEPMRTSPKQINARKLAYIDIDETIAYIAKANYEYLTEKGLTSTDDARSTYLFYNKQN